MKIYKVTYRSQQEASEGFFFAPSLQKAKTNKFVDGNDITECNKSIFVLEIKPTKKEIIQLLNFHAYHNDNG